MYQFISSFANNHIWFYVSAVFNLCTVGSQPLSNGNAWMGRRCENTTEFDY